MLIENCQQQIMREVCGTGNDKAGEKHKDLQDNKRRNSGSDYRASPQKKWGLHEGHCLSSFLQRDPALISLGLFRGKDSMVGENGRGGPMPGHRVDVLELLSLFPLPDSVSLVPGSASSCFLIIGVI